MASSSKNMVPSPPSRHALENASPATRLLEKRRQMFQVQEALEAQKAEFARKEEAFRVREEALKRKDLELQESLIRFSKFLQENDSKRARAEKKAADEVRVRQARERDIDGLTAVLEQLRDKRERSREALEEFMPYRNYLESVLEVAEQYQEIGDVLSRHATLQATNEELRDQQARAVTDCEAQRAELTAMTHQQADQLLRLNNQLAVLRQKLEVAQAAATQEELGKDARLHLASQRSLEYGQVVLAADTIYARCRAVSHVSRGVEVNPLLQLEAIGNFVADLTFIVRRAGLPLGSSGTAQAVGSNATAACASVGTSASTPRGKKSGDSNGGKAQPVSSSN